MRTDQEKRYSRVAEGIYRYKSGGFHSRQKVEGKTTWRKLKSIELQGPMRQAREILKNGILIQRKQPARMLAEFSRDELARSSNAAEAAREKVGGCHAKVLARRIECLRRFGEKARHGKVHRRCCWSMWGEQPSGLLLPRGPGPGGCWRGQNPRLGRPHLQRNLRPELWGSDACRGPHRRPCVPGAKS